MNNHIYQKTQSITNLFAVLQVLEKKILGMRGKNRYKTCKYAKIISKYVKLQRTGKGVVSTFSTRNAILSIAKIFNSMQRRCIYEKKMEGIDRFGACGDNVGRVYARNGKRG
ncbi:hypothetical protein [Blautia producta]|uniref:Transposase n=1 Tax=Blautia producta ATCC 27340 = DSM 2950 TaxID=1121114 RepID=A0ABX6JDF0_9FIRM|nr:hypothetical protein [Blautia producta]QIB56173.1 hypothetical protein GXM18_15655 [Blautia producta ATCC 27340 = DSM 2950]